MPIIQSDRLSAVVAEIFDRAGCDRKEAERVAESLVGANLRGHDSHGVIRTLRYVTWLETGWIKAGHPVRVVRESPVMAVLDAEQGFGQSAAERAVEIGIEKAKAMEISVVTLKNAGHIGRVGQYAEQAAAAGLVSIHFVNARSSELVAPFGARERRFSTAPFAVGIPQNGAPPYILDFATSIVAEGKVLVAAQGGKSLPKGALINDEGDLTEDPIALYSDAKPPNYRNGTGAIRAMGEHKGSGLALMCELLGGAFSGNGAAGPASGKPFANGMLSIYLTPAAFAEEDNFFSEEVRRYVDHVKSAAPAAGVDKVLVPGEPELERLEARRRDGLELPEDVWNSILEAAEKAGLQNSEARSIAGVN